jgi:hypothetical protein
VLILQLAAIDYFVSSQLMLDFTTQEHGVAFMLEHNLRAFHDDRLMQWLDVKVEGS